MLGSGSRPGMMQGQGGVSSGDFRKPGGGQGSMSTLEQLAMLQQQKAAQTGQPIGATGAAQNPLTQGVTSLTQGIQAGSGLQQLLAQLQGGKAGANGSVGLDTAGVMMPQDAGGGAGGLDPLKMAAASQLQNK